VICGVRLVAVIVTCVLGLWPFVASAQAAPPPCQFELGFKALHDMIPTTVGNCLEDENHNPANGDGLQHTAGGLLVWRKLDNWTAFTDGSRTWINGPQGPVTRPNSERYAWESNPDGLPIAGGGDTLYGIVARDH
jgi:hypothetical protein